jgi:hypothetical protein
VPSEFFSLNFAQAWTITEADGPKTLRRSHMYTMTSALCLVLVPADRLVHKLETRTGQCKLEALKCHSLRCRLVVKHLLTYLLIYFGTIGQKWPQYKGLSPTPLAIILTYLWSSALLEEPSIL